MALPPFSNFVMLLGVSKRGNIYFYGVSWMVKNVFSFCLAFLFFQQNAFAWWGSDNNYKNRDNAYEVRGWSYKSADWNKNFTYSSSYEGQTYIPAKSNFFTNTLYESKIRLESSNPGFSDFVRTKVAPNITGADYGGYKISNNVKFESYSALSKSYESFSLSNVKESNGKLTGFDRASARGSWIVKEDVRNISYSNNGRLAGYQLSAKDIARNSFTQNISNLKYADSRDSNRLAEIQRLAENNSGREGYYMWKDVRNGLEGLGAPATLVPEAFNLTVTDANGIRNDFAFTDVTWKNDRMVGFTANFRQGGKMTEMKAIPTLNESGKIDSLTVQISKPGGAQQETWDSKSGANLAVLAAAMFKGINPLELLGAGHVQVDNMMAPASAVTFDERGLLPNAEKDFARNYGLENNPIFGAAANDAKKEIFQLEQTDEKAVRDILWNTDLNDLAKKDLGTIATDIKTTIQGKFEKLRKTVEVSSSWGDALKTNAPLDLKLEHGRITSANEFTNAAGQRVANVSFKLLPEGKLQAVEAFGQSGTRTEKKLGTGFKAPELSPKRSFFDKNVSPLVVQAKAKLLPLIQVLKESLLNFKNQSQNMVKSSERKEIESIKNYRAILNTGKMESAIISAETKRLGHLYGYQEWENNKLGDQLSNNVLFVQDGNEYNKVYRKIIGSQIEVLRTEKVDQKIFTDHSKGAASTWCNFLVRDVAKGFGVSESFSSSEDNANTMALKLSQGKYNTPQTVFREVAWQDAQKYANKGGFAVAAWENPKGQSGHIAIVDKNSNAHTDLKNLLLFHTDGKNNYGHKKAGYAFRKDQLNEIQFYIWEKL